MKQGTARTFDKKVRNLFQRVGRPDARGIRSERSGDVLLARYRYATSAVAAPRPGFETDHSTGRRRGGRNFLRMRPAGTGVPFAPKYFRGDPPKTRHRVDCLGVLSTSGLNCAVATAMTTRGG